MAKTLLQDLSDKTMDPRENNHVRVQCPDCGKHIFILQEKPKEYSCSVCGAESPNACNCEYA